MSNLTLFLPPCTYEIKDLLTDKALLYCHQEIFTQILTKIDKISKMTLVQKTMFAIVFIRNILQLYQTTKEFMFYL